MSRFRRRDTRHFGQVPGQRPPTMVIDDLGHTLDGLNAWGCLEEWREADLKSINCYGPGVFRGYHPAAWAGVILWYKRRGYYYYQTLYMVGVWAVRSGDREAISVMVGTKEAAFSQPIFHPEGYYRRIQTEFKTLYDDSGSPPAPERRLYASDYDPAQRLAMRRAVAAALAAWADSCRNLWMAQNRR